jgi:competence protein ComEA
MFEEMNRRVVQTFLGSALIGASLVSAGFFAWQARNDAPVKIEVAGSQPLDASALLTAMNQPTNAGTVAGETTKSSNNSTSSQSVPAPASVNINTATQAQLETLPGIGPVIAGRIIEYRTANGGFRSVGQLEAVKGIGPKTLEKLRSYVTL